MSFDVVLHVSLSRRAQSRTAALTTSGSSVCCRRPKPRAWAWAKYASCLRTLIHQTRWSQKWTYQVHRGARRSSDRLDYSGRSRPTLASRRFL